jgi:hypothetical protein
MRTLIYKRTHPGDPDTGGRFGIDGCMGQVRSWDFDSVIGVGGIGPEPSSHCLSRKINWIGIGARKHFIFDERRPIVTFDRFVLYEEDGPDFAALAPTLARRLYGQNVRVLLHRVSDRERREIRRILALAADAPASPSASRIRVSRHGKHRTDFSCRCRDCRTRRSQRASSGGC